MIKRLTRQTLVVTAALLLSGCGTIHLNAPPSSNITLLSKNVPTSVRIEQKVWFNWWGMEPIDNAQTARIIEENQLKEVRLYMTSTMMDGIFSIFPGMIGFPRRTLIVEGNR